MKSWKTSDGRTIYQGARMDKVERRKKRAEFWENMFPLVFMLLYGFVFFILPGLVGWPRR